MMATHERHMRAWWELNPEYRYSFFDDAGAARLVVASDGLEGLFLRGLGTRLLANVLQASLFTIVWKQIEHYMVYAGLL